MFNDIIDFTKAKFDDNDLLVVNDHTQIKNLGGKIDPEEANKMRAKQEDMARNKFPDHWRYIQPTGVFNSQTIYLEIGCWPAYLGEYLMINFDSYFIGVDFNYTRLLI